MQLHAHQAYPDIPVVVSHHLINLIFKKALIEQLKCVYSECIKVVLIKSELYYPLDYLENKINSLFNQSQEWQEKRKQTNKKMPRGSHVITYMERNNVNKHGERISV